MIEGRNIHAGYGEKDVLRGADFSFAPGQITVVIGPNGCGKSTLLKTVIGLLPPKKGELLADGEDLTAMPPARRAERVSYLPQSRKTPDMTVQTLVLHGRFSRLQYPRRYGQADREAAEKAMKWAGIDSLREEKMSRLSGGMQQKAYLAMAFCQDADTLLLDEPTTFLDVAHQLRLMDRARMMARAGKAVVLVLHDLPLALSRADRLIVMDGGRVCFQGGAEALLQTGLLEQVFGVRVKTVWDEKTPHYLCELCTPENRG